MKNCKYLPLKLLVILMCRFQLCWSEICSSLVEDISVNQCDSNQRFSRNLVDTNGDLSCMNFIHHISHTVVNTDHGIVNYSIPLPSSDCRYTRYTFKLIASNSSLCKSIDEISLLGNHGNQVTRLHSNYAYEYSVKNVRVTWCNESTCHNTCSNSNILYLTFEYVSTQCYQLVAQPFISQDSQNQLYSKWHFVDTKYTPILPHKFAPQFDWRHDSHENSVMVRLIINSNLTSRPIASCLEVMSGVESNGEHACHETGIRMSQCLVWFGDTRGQSSLTGGCDKDRNTGSAAISKCTSETENELVCSIENVGVGNYCVVMQFLDERCQDSESACSWHKMFVVNNKSSTPQSYSSLVPASSPLDSSLSPTLLLIVSILMLLGVAAILVVRTCHRRSLSMSRYKHFVLPMSRAPSSVVDTFPLRDRKLLFLYARDCEQVTSVITAFKTFLQSTGKCQVFDYWDIEHFNAVARNPMAWINAHLSDEDTSVIIINTEVAQLLLHSQMTNFKPCTVNHTTGHANGTIPSSNQFTGQNCGKMSTKNDLMGQNSGVSCENELSEQKTVTTPLGDQRNKPKCLLGDSDSVQGLDPGQTICDSCPDGILPMLSSNSGHPSNTGRRPGSDNSIPLLHESDHSSQTLHSCHYSSNRVNVKYKDAKCFDHLFVVGLRSLALHCSTNTRSNLSERVYIVEFDADLQSMCSSFLLPITLTRFILPQHMESLLYHIHSLSPLSKQFSVDSSDDDYLKLRHSIELMTNHKSRQPQYPLDLLVNVV
uniref:SEFIR domain-containing protein n=1 Tax=Cacopsylla melanoneura TaxID=428564 RepID=A0A8D9DZN2_9HEMI